MKRGWKWLVWTAVLCLAICGAGSAAAQSEPEGQNLPAITVTGTTEGEYWVYETSKIQIDATDAGMLYLTVTEADSSEKLVDEEAMHENEWAWMGDPYYGWGSRHETVNREITFQRPGDYVIAARGYWGEAAEPADNDPGWQTTTQTITVQQEEDRPGAPEISLSNVTEDAISRGELLNLSVTPAEGLTYYNVLVYAADANHNITGNPLFSTKFSEAVNEYRIPTWEMEGECILRVISVAARHPARTDDIHFTVNGDAPEGVTWKLTKNTVDTDEPFAVSVYIPGAKNIQFSFYQGGRIITSSFSSGATAVYNGLRLPYGPDKEAAFFAYDHNGNKYVCDLPLTINETVDVPTPVFVNFPKMLAAGEDLTFTLQVDESKITKGPITYDARLYKNEYAVGTATSSEGTVTVTVPWSAFEDYQETEPGISKTLYVRAHGPGYNGKDIEEGFVIGGEQDNGFRIAFADTEENHKRIYVQEGFTLAVTLPDDTAGIEYIEILNGYNWERYNLADIPATGIETGHYRYETKDKPVMARYHTTAGEDYYSNLLYVDYMSHGPLPAPTASTNLTEEADGTLSIEQGIPLNVFIDNCEDYVGKGGPYLMAWITRAEDGQDGNQSVATNFGTHLDDDDVWISFQMNSLPGTGDYVLYLQAYDSTYQWNASETTEIPFTVANKMEIGELSFTVSKEEVLTGEGYYLTAYAPGAETIEFWDGYPDENNNPWTTGDGPYFQTGSTTGREAEYTFYAKAYYPDRDPVISGPVNVRIINPYGKLEDALRYQEPGMVAANEPITVTLETVDPDTTGNVIPETMSVYLYDEDGDTVFDDMELLTNTVVIPAAENGQSILEAGKSYRLEIWATKPGYTMYHTSHTLTVTAAEPAGPVFRIDGQSESTVNFYVGEYILFEGSLKGARMFQLLITTDEDEPEILQAYDIGADENGWAGKDLVFRQPGYYRAYGYAYCWEGAATPTDLGEGIRTETIRFHVDSLGPVLEEGTTPVKGPVANSVTQGEVLEVPINWSDYADQVHAVIYTGNTVQGDPVAQYDCSPKNPLFLPTWNLIPGTYCLEITMSGWRYEDVTQTLCFTVNSPAEPIDPEAIQWSLLGVSNGAEIDTETPFTVGVYCPGADAVTLLIYYGVNKNIYDSFHNNGDWAVMSPVINWSGEITIGVAKTTTGDNGKRITEKIMSPYTLTVKEGIQAPVPIITCGQNVVAGEPYTFSFAEGKKEAGKDYSGVRYDLEIHQRYFPDSKVVLENLQPGETQIPWEKLASIYATEGVTLSFDLNAHGIGYYSIYASKETVVTGTRDSQFRIGFAGENWPDHAHIKQQSGYSIQLEIPEGPETYEVWEGCWSTWSVHEVTETEIEMPSVYYETAFPIVARYRTDDGYRYSNAIYLTTQCMHENGTYEGTVDLGYRYAPVEGENANKEHAIYQIMADAVYCSDCNAVLEQGEPYEQYLMNLEHWYDNDETNICNLCGHVNTCRHESVTPYKVFFYEVYAKEIEGNNKYHLAVGYGDDYDTCDICRRPINHRWVTYINEYGQETNYVTEMRQHNYVDGVCTGCGHVYESHAELTLILPADLKRIESGAFDGIGAEAVFIPAGCEYIGPGAFVNCDNLVYVEYYEGTEVDPDAFGNTEGLAIIVKQR